MSVRTEAKAEQPETQKVSAANVSKFRLYEINDSVTEITDMLEFTIDETGEVVDEMLEAKILARLAELNIAREVKASNIAIYIKSVEGEAAIVAKEKERLAKREKALTNKAAWLIKYLTACLQEDPSKPGAKISGVRTSIAWRKSDTLIVNKAERLPLKFQKISVSDVTEEELILFKGILSRLKGYSVEARKDLLKRHMKARSLEKGRRFRHLANIQEKYTIQIK